MKEKVGTGIEGFDKLFYGGISIEKDLAKDKSGLIIAITGERGVHKTKFAMQLGHGLVKAMLERNLEVKLVEKFLELLKCIRIIIIALEGDEGETVSTVLDKLSSVQSLLKVLPKEQEKDECVNLLASVQLLWDGVTKEQTEDDFVNVLASAQSLWNRVPKEQTKDDFVNVLASAQSLWNRVPKELTEDDFVNVLASAQLLRNGVPENMQTKNNFVQLLGRVQLLWKRASALNRVPKEQTKDDFVNLLELAQSLMGIVPKEQTKDDFVNTLRLVLDTIEKYKEEPAEPFVVWLEGQNVDNGIAKWIKDEVPQIAKCNDAKYYSLNKDKPDLESTYYNTFLTQYIDDIIERFMRDDSNGVSNLTEELMNIIKDDDQYIHSLIDCGCGKQQGEQQVVDKFLLDECLKKRIVYYNNRSQAFYFSTIANEGIRISPFLDTQELKELLNKLSVPCYLEFDDCEDKEREHHGFRKTSHTKLQGIIEGLAYPKEEEKQQRYSCIVIDGISDINTDNLKTLAFTHMEDTLRQHTNVAIVVFDERYKDVKFNADIVIEMRSNKSEEEKYMYHELQIAKSVFQTAAFGWHQYKLRDYGIEVFPSLHSILQKRNYLSNIILTTGNGILHETYDSCLSRRDYEKIWNNGSDSSNINYADYKSSREKLEKKLLNRILCCNKKSNLLQNILLNQIDSSIPRWHEHPYSTAIIGNPHSFKRKLLNAKIFSAASKSEDTLVLLFDRDLSIARKQMICPYHRASTSTEDIIGCCYCFMRWKCSCTPCRCCSYIHPLPIRMGCISAEELFAVLEKQIRIRVDMAKKKDDTTLRIKHIVIDDLQKIDYSFPFIKNNPLFLSALIVFCRERNIELTILCDKKSSFARELCALADNVICTEREVKIKWKYNKNGEKERADSVTLYVEKNVYSPDLLMKYEINDIDTIFHCKNGQPEITCGEGTPIGSMKEYWRSAENVYVRER